MRVLSDKRDSERGWVLIWMAGMLVMFLLFAGLAIDLGRGYLVKIQLSKAVDGAALAAGRSLASSMAVDAPKLEARRIFTDNFPSGYMGVTSLTSTSDPSFYSYVYDADTGANKFTVSATAVLPTLFLKIIGLNSMNVFSTGEATRKLLDMALVLDVSGSIAPSWSIVSAAASNFVNSFDGDHDRMALIVYSDGGKVMDAIRTGTNVGFDKATISSHITGYSPAGSTAMAEGIYRGYDELEAIAPVDQHSLRVLVLFTDGCANGVPADYSGIGNTGTPIPATSCVIATNDAGNGVFGLTDTLTFSGSSQYYTTQAWDYITNTSSSFPAYSWNTPGRTLYRLRYMPTVMTPGGRRSSTVPSTFPLQSSTLTVKGVTQSTARALDTTYAHLSGATPYYYEANRRNINNSARNLVEIIANDARARYAGNTTAPYPIRIYTIGMGSSLRTLYGYIPEYGQDLLIRTANDTAAFYGTTATPNADYNSNQRRGRFYYAPTAASVNNAFTELRSELLRLSK